MARPARIDLVAEFQCCLARSRYEIFARRGVQNTARRADDEPRTRSGLPTLHSLRDVAALRANSWHQERHVAYDLANFSQLARVGRADDESAIPSRIPTACGEIRNDVEQPPAADLQIL